jgi:acyl carrier protein
LAGDIGLHVIMARGPAKEGSSVKFSTLTNVLPDSKWLRMADADVSAANEAMPAIHALLREKPLSERPAILLDVICKEIAHILHLPVDRMPRKRDRLMDLGMDSLMAVELRNRLASELGLNNLPATLMFDYPTPDAITEYLLNRLENMDSVIEETPSPVTPVSNEQSLTAQEVADLSEEDIATLLRSRLSR